MKLEVETALDKHLKVLNDIGPHKFPRLFKVFKCIGKILKKNIRLNFVVLLNIDKKCQSSMISPKNFTSLNTFGT